jgi:hypothetical protein
MINIQFLDGSYACAVAISDAPDKKGWLVRKLKQALENELSVPAGSQKLIRGSQRLGDDTWLTGTADLFIVHSHHHPDWKKWVEQALLDPAVMNDAPKDVRDDTEVFLSIFSSKPRLLAWQNNRASVLQYASQEVRDDEEVVKMAVQSCPLALQFASEELRTNEQIVGLAIHHSIKHQIADVVGCTAKEMRSNVHVALAASQKLACNQLVQC